jgi:two-component system, NtrC family, sensor kinase
MDKLKKADNNYQRELLDSILNSSTEYAIIATDLNDKIVLWNKGAELIYGYTSDEMIGNQTPMNLHRKYSIDNDILLLYENTFRSNIFDCRMNALRKDGSTIPISVTVTPRSTKNNKAAGYLIISRDITKAKLQEQFRNVLNETAHIISTSNTIDEMCNSAVNLISKVLDIPVIFICIFDKSNNSFAINSQVGLDTKYKSHFCNLSHQDEMLHTDRVGCFLTSIQLTINSAKLSGHAISKYVEDKDIAAADTSIIHIPLMSDIALLGILHIALPTARKEFILTETQVLSLIANEISTGIQRKRLEEEIKKYSDNLEKMVKERTDQLREKDAQLVQSGKLATLGEMATGIAHEINQPLGGINLIAQGLLMAKERGKLNDSILCEKLNSIVEQIERINKIITHLRIFARQSEEVKQSINVQDPITDVFKLIGQQLVKRDITIEMDVPDQLYLVLADHNMLEQVFLNIIGNARDALDDFEKVVDDLKSRKEEPRWLRSWIKTIFIRAFNHEEAVIVEIEDNAGGIPKHILNRIFEPFYTTKDVGKGTGLGLSITYGIVKEFGGTIEVKSEEMKGSKFIIKLPAAK